MSRPISISDTLTFAPTSNVSTTNMSASSSYPASNGYTDASSNTYTRFSVTRNQVGSTYYVFSVGIVGLFNMAASPDVAFQSD